MLRGSIKTGSEPRLSCNGCQHQHRQEGGERYLPSRVLQLSPEGTLRHQVSPEVKKLVSVSATSTPVTETREKTVETAKAVKTAEAVESAKVGKDGAESKSEYPNLVQVSASGIPSLSGRSPYLCRRSLTQVVKLMPSTQLLPGSLDFPSGQRTLEHKKSTAPYWTPSK